MAKLEQGVNDLATVNPELAAQWDYKANKGLKDENGRDISTPDKVTAGSSKKVGWIIHYNNVSTGVNFDYRWKASISDRSRGTEAPILSSSAGEKLIYEFLQSQNINFKEQYTFENRTFKNKLRDDFAIFDRTGKVIGTIEFHGKQHYRPVDFGGLGEKVAQEQFARNQLRDKIKSDYLLSYGIKQLVVPYTDIGSAIEMVKVFIDDLAKEYQVYPTVEERVKYENIKPWKPENNRRRKHPLVVKNVDFDIKM